MLKLVEIKQFIRKDFVVHDPSVKCDQFFVKIVRTSLLCLYMYVFRRRCLSLSSYSLYNMYSAYFQLRTGIRIVCCDSLEDSPVIRICDRKS